MNENKGITIRHRNGQTGEFMPVDPAAEKTKEASLAESGDKIQMTGKKKKTSSKRRDLR